MALAHSFDVIVASASLETESECVNRHSSLAAPPSPSPLHFFSLILSLHSLPRRQLLAGDSSNLVQQNLEGATEGMDGAKATAARMEKQR
jgi:hypothetical protein